MSVPRGKLLVSPSRALNHARRSITGLIRTTGPKKLILPWIVILLAGYLGDLAGMPVAWLVCPMIAAVALSLSGSPPEPSTARLFPAVQAIIGTTLSASFTLDSLRSLSDHWLPVSISVVLVLMVSVVAGVMLTRVASLDMATASFGTIPGGASSMVAMSEELGGDARLVAFKQYARVVIVIITIAILARVVDVQGEPAAAQLAAEAGDPMVVRYGLAVFVAVVGGWLGVRLRLPAGSLVGPMLLGLIPGLIGIGPIAWPGFVLSGAFLLLGARVGSRFDRSIVRRLWTLLPFALAFVTGLIIICGGIGWALHLATDLDMLTALLATSPGGIDAATIAALDTGANVTMVASIQMMRLLLMVMVGPLIVRRMVARSMPVRVTEVSTVDPPERTP